MPVSISTVADEKSTYIITCDFADELGAATVPDSIVWSLTDNDGTVINSLNQISETPAASVDVVLSGDDLQILTGESANIVIRRFTVEWTYTSDAGSNLPGKVEAYFPLENLTKII
jgi:hypothetical protein